MAPAHASLFGSVARGDADASSDVDLLVVRPAGVGGDDARWRAQLDGLAHQVRRWTGNAAANSEIPEAEVDRLANERPPVIERIASDAIDLAGTPARALFRPRAS